MKKAPELKRELDAAVEKKFPPNLAPNMKVILDRMRDCKYEEDYKKGVEVGALYLPAQATADDLEALETDFAHMGQTFVYHSLEQGDPPQKPDSVESLQAKIQCVNNLDVSRVSGKD